MAVATFREITENECVKERHPLSKAIIWSILRDNWKTVRARMSISIVHMQNGVINDRRALSLRKLSFLYITARDDEVGV